MQKILSVFICTLLFITGANAQMINTNPTGNMTSGICGDAAQYQKVFETLKAKGFRPVHISSRWVTIIDYGPAPHFEYSATFEKKHNTPEWVAHHVLNADQYKSELDAWTAKGYMPTDINIAYSRRGGFNYCLIMEKIVNAPEWQERHGISVNDVGKFDAQLLPLGYSRVITSESSIDLFYAACLWTKPRSIASIPVSGTPPALKKINCINGTIVIPEALKPSGEIGAATFKIEVYEMQNIQKCVKECYQGTLASFPAAIEYGTLTHSAGNYNLPVSISKLDLSKFAESVYVIHIIPTFKTSWTYPFYESDTHLYPRLKFSNAVEGTNYGQIVFYPGDMVVFNPNTTSKNVDFMLTLRQSRY